MKIEAEKSRYHGGEGWELDPQLFAQTAVTWRQWIGQASEHLYAAQILLPHVQQYHAEVNRLMEARHQGRVAIAPSLAGVYFLHCAFCIENAFKCAIVAERASEIESEMRTTNKIPGFILTHDLVGLATKAGFEIGTDEEYTLSFLSRYGIWAGRYPLPTRNADYALTKQLSDGNHYLVAGYGPEKVPAFVAFCATVYIWARSKADSGRGDGGP